jgi:hypothetical protein
MQRPCACRAAATVSLRHCRASAQHRRARSEQAERELQRAASEREYNARQSDFKKHRDQIEEDEQAQVVSWVGGARAGCRCDSLLALTTAHCGTAAPTAGAGGHAPRAGAKIGAGKGEAVGLRVCVCMVPCLALRVCGGNGQWEYERPGGGGI